MENLNMGKDLRVEVGGEAWLNKYPTCDGTHMSIKVVTYIKK